MERAVTAGIGVNMTLLVYDSHYLRTADATCAPWCRLWLAQRLERRPDLGLSLIHI